MDKSPATSEIPNASGAPDHPGFADIDRHFAAFIGRFGKGEMLPLAAKHLSRAVRHGHLCLDLATPPADLEAGMQWPSLEEWRCELRGSGSRAVGFVGGVDNVDGVGGTPARLETPLILDAAGRLYLRRYYEYEQALAAALRERSRPFTASSSDANAATEGQDAAVEAALAQPLTVISGGPGTGKTTTVVRILERVMDQAVSAAQSGGGETPRIVLCAPTGKAAARLEEAVRGGLRKLNRPELAAWLARMPRAKTLDRLLGSRPGTTALRHHAGNPLPVDLAVVDEASMVALPLMAKLFDALLPQARVILLGDRDQLASVAPGSVLADLADAAGEPASPLNGAMVTLRKNFRFGNDSAIFRLCEAIREGDAKNALAIVADPTQADLGGSPLPAAGDLAARLREPVLAGYGPYLAERDPARALEAFSRFRLLCALRRGPYGVDGLNRQIEAILGEARLIQGGHRFYAGMPVLITRNDYQLNLFNGDIGILLPDPSEPLSPDIDAGEKPLWAWFPSDNIHTSHVNQAGGVTPRRVSPSRLPDHELAYAMTVHKSQGSEFERVLLVLPDRDLPLLTRELIYTGLTRARTRVDLWFEATLFARGIARRAQRVSGLRDALASGRERRAGE